VPSPYTFMEFKLKNAQGRPPQNWHPNVLKHSKSEAAAA
jgi:hypothetical protein